MKNLDLLALMLLALPIVFSSCEVVGDIFQAGMIVGILAVVLVVALII